MHSPTPAAHANQAAHPRLGCLSLTKTKSRTNPFPSTGTISANYFTRSATKTADALRTAPAGTAHFRYLVGSTARKTFRHINKRSC